MERKRRSKDLGYLFVVGGPGGSGSTVISKMLAEHFHLRRMNGGDSFRDVVRSRGYKDFDDFYYSSNMDLLLELDKEVDMKLIEYSKEKNILIESKVFSAVAYTRDISCTVKIWINASLHQRTLRHLGKMKFPSFFSRFFAYWGERFDLRRRWNLDKKRFFSLYGIDYAKPEVYNDIVIDSSRLNEEETFYLILKLLKDGQYLEE